LINTEREGSKGSYSKMEISLLGGDSIFRDEVIGAYADPKNMLRLLKLILMIILI